MNVLIKRDISKKEITGTVGVMFLEGKEFCQTLELPWLNNEENKSCIPTGSYTCKRINSPAHGNVFEIINVPNRTHVLIHTGNFLKDFKGCVGVGMIRGQKDGEWCIYKSKEAFDSFMEAMKGVNEFTLTIE